MWFRLYCEREKSKILNIIQQNDTPTQEYFLNVVYFNMWHGVIVLEVSI